MRSSCYRHSCIKAARKFLRLRGASTSSKSRSKTSSTAEDHTFTEHLTFLAPGADKLATMTKEIGQVNKLSIPTIYQAPVCHAAPPFISRRHQLMTQPHPRPLMLNGFYQLDLSPKSIKDALWKQTSALKVYSPTQKYRHFRPKQNTISKTSRINQQQQYGPQIWLSQKKDNPGALSLHKLHGGEFDTGAWWLCKIRGSREGIFLDKNFILRNRKGCCIRWRS